MGLEQVFVYHSKLKIDFAYDFHSFDTEFNMFVFCK